VQQLGIPDSPGVPTRRIESRLAAHYLPQVISVQQRPAEDSRSAPHAV